MNIMPSSLYTLEQLSQSELTSVLVNNSPLAYIILNKHLEVMFINEYFLKLRQYKKHDVLGEKCYNLSNNGVPCQICAVKNALRTKTRQYVLRKDTLASGAIRYMDDYAIPLTYNAKGEVEYILEMMINRTDEMKLRKQLDENFKEIVRSLTALLGAKDAYTASHSLSVRSLSVKLAQAMGMDSEFLLDIDFAASLHDIGKVEIPNGIINKPGRLTEDEFAIIKRHPLASHELIKTLSGFKSVKDYVLYHHERFDGRGYPGGIAGDNIPLGARVIAVADTYDAMTSTRSYRKALDHEVAMQEILKNAGTQFDPLVVQAFAALDFASGEAQIAARPGAQVERSIVAIAQPHHAEPTERDLGQIVPESELITRIFENAPVGYAVFDHDHAIHFVSDCFCEMMGINRADLADKRCYEINHIGGKICQHCVIETAIRTGKPATDTLRKTTPNGEKCFESYAVPFQGHDRGYIIQVLIDRTEQMALQSQRETDLLDLIQTLKDLLARQATGPRLFSDSMDDFAVVLGRRMGLDEHALKDIETAATLCDIGEFSLFETADSAPNREAHMRAHPRVAFDIFSSVSGLTAVKDVILHHHERYDGKGYPDGISGQSIPLSARIIAVADAYFKARMGGLTRFGAFEAVAASSGTLYDPSVVEALGNEVRARGT